MSSLFQPWFEAVVSAITYSTCWRQAAPGKPELSAPYNDVVQLLLEQWSRMPDYLRPAMKAAALGFDSLALFRKGQLFHNLPAVSRAELLNTIKGTGTSRPHASSLAAERDLVRYFESLAVLALHSRAEKDRAKTLPHLESLPSASPLSSPPLLRSHPNTGIGSRGEHFCEVLVVGSGPGGAITACLLAEAGRSVVLMEEGPYLPLHSCPPFSFAEMRTKYRNGGQTVAMGATKVAYVEGRCVGGGSEINSGLYHRTPATVLEQWRSQFQVDAATEADLLPHFEACERDLSVSPMPGTAPAASLKLHEGAAKLGWKSLEVPRWFKYGPDGGGVRQSMTETYIPRFLRAGGQLLPQSRALSLHQDGIAWRMRAMNSGRELRVRAETVILCAGAVQTPAILLRSGIGRNVGTSLQLHPTVKVLATFPQDINSEHMGVPVHQVKEFAPKLTFGCSISSKPYLALGLLDHPVDPLTLESDWQRMANYYAMIAPEGTGTVRLLPGFRDALVRYSLTETDRKTLADGLRKLAALLFESGAQWLHPSLTGVGSLSLIDHLGKLPAVLPDGKSNLMTIHLFSSCRMGENQGLCTTNSFGRLHGFKNLYVNDASLLCSAPGVNPQGTIMALARRNALHFLSQKR